MLFLVTLGNSLSQKWSASLEESWKCKANPAGALKTNRPFGDLRVTHEALRAHQRRLRAAVGGLILWEEQRVFGQHGDGSQHERHKQVHMDVVPGAVQPPAHKDVEKCVYRARGREATG